MSSTENTSFNIRVSSTDEVFEVPENRTILHVLYENGYEVPLDCSNGRCGTCRTRYLSGEIDHRDTVLEDSERSEFLTVCVSRATGGELVLDLEPPVDSAQPITRPIAVVNAPVCVACLNCVRFCTFGAAKIDSGLMGVGGIQGAAIVDKDLCTGCGLCAAACPTGAIEMNVNTHDVVIDAINQFSSGPASQQNQLSKTPNSLVIFTCPQSRQTTQEVCAGDSRTKKTDAATHVVEVPCSGRVDTLQLMHAFEKGADGVMVVGCQPGECYFNTGNLHVKQRVDRVSQWLDKCGLHHDRVMMTHITPGDHKGLANAIDSLDEKTQALGLTPLHQVAADRT
ncbi:MAG: hydrogenase iron-sulfur subunit [Proteobacteria bacterium]|nr:hydrogenase iron-sulfur subunit [Pseudomonadota bacterium]